MQSKVPLCAGLLLLETRSHCESVRLELRKGLSRIGPLLKVMMYGLNSSFGRWRMTTRPCFAQPIAPTNSMRRHCCCRSVSFSLVRFDVFLTPFSSVSGLDH